MKWKGGGGRQREKVIHISNNIPKLSVTKVCVCLCLWLISVSVSVAHLLICICPCRSHNPRLAAGTESESHDMRRQTITRNSIHRCMQT